MSAENLPEYTPPTGPEEPQEEKEKVKIRCSVFFDGTLNNRTNIEQRLKAMPKGDLTAEELAYLSQTKLTAEERAQAKTLYDQYKANDPNDDNSYEAYFSNIVKLERHLNTKASDPEYQHRLKVYVEGSGSIDRAKDDQAGFAFAKGIAGIEQKVDLGLTRALKEIKKAYNKAYKDKSKPIDITLDVFGFSRGAACARYFIHRALFDYDGSQYRAYLEALKAGHDVSLAEVQVAIQSQQAIKNALENDDYTVGEVKICFAGLFDTVSSFGYLLVLNSNNTEDLKLHAVDRAEEAVHLTAADEHRQYFSLTDIASAGAKGREVYLPGVHSDIGGGYRETSTEKKQLVYQGPQAEAEADRQRLIAAGWYTQDEIELMRIQLKDIKLEDVALKEPALKALGYTRFKNAVQYAQTRVTHRNLSNHYSRIPLHLMAGYARKKKLVFMDELTTDEEVPKALDDAQQKLNAYVAQHDALGARTSKPEHWHDNTRAWLRELRHRYFHFSAQVKKGHTPRLESGQRIRQVHRG